MGNNAITDCFFDLYGTLINIHTDENRSNIWDEVHAEILKWGEDCNLSPEQMKDCFYWAKNYMLKLSQDDEKHQTFPELNMYPIFSFLLSQCGVMPLENRITRIAETFRIASTEHCYLYSGAKEFLLKLKQSGRRIWLVTNAQRLFTLREIKNLGLDTVFDGIYISSDIGFKKPDIRIFLAPINEHKLNPNNIVMIGNESKADILGAKACGLKTIYFYTNCSPKNDVANADLCLDGADYDSAFKWITAE